MQKGVHSKFVDMSTSVREAAVELIGRFVLNKPELILQYYDMIIERILVSSSHYLLVQYVKINMIFTAQEILEFQLCLMTSSSQILLVLGNNWQTTCLISCKPMRQLRMRRSLPRGKIYLFWTSWTAVLSSPDFVTFLSHSSDTDKCT